MHQAIDLLASEHAVTLPDLAQVTPRAEVELPLEPRLATWIDGCDIDPLRATYRSQNEAVWAGDFVPPDLVADLRVEADRLESRVVRKYVPLIKQSGAVSFHQIREAAPNVVALYRSPAFIGLVERIVGRRLQTCPGFDAHACALYFYTEPGDHIGWHYDTSHYEGERFTVLIALTDDSSARLLLQLFRGAPDRATEHLELATRPGTFVVFNGDKLYHAVSPIAAGERRVVLSLEYVTSRRMGRWRRFITAMKDAFGYFGFRQLIFGARERRAGDTAARRSKRAARQRNTP